MATPAIDDLDEYEARSTDGSDTEGSLCEFIVDDDEDLDEKNSHLDNRPEHKILLEEFPYDKELLKESNSSGPRRSKRKRTTVTRYQDPDYAKLMFEDVGEDDLSGSEESNGKTTHHNSDSDFVHDSASSDDDDDSSVEETQEGDFPYDE